MDARQYGVSLPGETPAASAEYAALARVDAAAALHQRGVVLPDHFDGRRKWRGLLALPTAEPTAPGDECARALADRVAIVSHGAVLLDLVAPHDGETQRRAADSAHRPSLVAFHRDQYVWGAHDPTLGRPSNGAPQFNINCPGR